MAAADAFQLDPTAIDEVAAQIGDAIVARVVEGMRAQGIIPQAAAARTWLDAQQVAEGLRMSREWVYEHAEQLGASRIGTGPRPRLRFPPNILDSPGGKPTTRQAATRSTNPRDGANGLIPIHAS